MKCTRCGATDMRTSRLRVSDLGRWLFLQRPVRCHACLKRGFVGLIAAARIRKAEGADQTAESSREDSSR